MDISIIIVSYNTKDLLKETIESVINTVKKTKYEIIVVDNASSDGSCDMIFKYFPEVVLIKNQNNDGFACANNKGIEIAKGIRCIDSLTKIIFITSSPEFAVESYGVKLF